MCTRSSPSPPFSPRRPQVADMPTSACGQDCPVYSVAGSPSFARTLWPWMLLWISPTWRLWCSRLSRTCRSLRLAESFSSLAQTSDLSMQFWPRAHGIPFDHVSLFKQTPRSCCPTVGGNDQGAIYSRGGLTLVLQAMVDEQRRQLLEHDVEVV